MENDAVPESTATAFSPHRPVRARSTALLIGAAATVVATVFQFQYFDCNLPLASTLTGAVTVGGIVAAPFLFLRPGAVGKLLAVGALGAAGVALFLNSLTHVCF